MTPGSVLATSGLERTAPWSSSATPAEKALPQMNADMVRENLAYRVFLHDTLGRGEIAWWSPYMYGGVPFAALNHTQVLYPPMWLAARFDPYRMYGTLTAFHFVVAGLGVFFWLRAARLSTLAGALGAVGARGVAECQGRTPAAEEGRRLAQRKLGLHHSRVRCCRIFSRSLFCARR